MHKQGSRSWVVAAAIVIVALLLFAGGYAAGMLRGQAATPVSSAASEPVASQPQAVASSQARSQDSQSVATSTSSVDSTSAASSTPPTSLAPSTPSNSSTPSTTTASIDEDGTYTSKDDVALYIHTYGHLPSNYISKTKAKKAGWVASKGNLDQVCPGKSIGGSEFYNYEGQLPDAPGRTWTECDINYAGGYRGAERIVFSNDGLVFYTADHYTSFEQLY